jgi:hypothetical protein
MITPILIEKIGWGTYLFFACINASFIPFIYFIYPETKYRSLEEIDIIFAKGFVEKTSYVEAAEKLPLLRGADVESYAKRYKLIDSSELEKDS